MPAWTHIPLSSTSHHPLHSTRQSTDHTIALPTTFHCPRHSTVHFIPLSTTFHWPWHRFHFPQNSTVHDILTFSRDNLRFIPGRDNLRFWNHLRRGTGHPSPPYHWRKVRNSAQSKSLIGSILLRMPRPVKLGNIQNSSQFIYLIYSNITNLK